MTHRALTIRLPEDEHNALRLHAFLSGSSLNETVARAIREFLLSKEPELFEQALEKLRREYRIALDKLADL